VVQGVEMVSVKYFNVHNMSDGFRGMLVNKALFSKDEIIVCNEDKHDRSCYIVPSELITLDDITNSTNVVVKKDNTVCLENTDFKSLYKLATMAHAFCEMNLEKGNVTNKKDLENSLALANTYIEKLFKLISKENSNG
jgi:hypothetical protein